MKTFKVTLLSLLIVTFFGQANYAQKSANTNKNNAKVTKVVSFQTSATCGSCKKTIESTLNSLNGVKSSSLNLDSKIVSVYYTEGVVTPEAIKKSIESKGYTATTPSKKSGVKKGCCGGKKGKCAGKKKKSCDKKK